MSSITYKQALDIMRQNPESCFDHVNAVKHVILPPKYVGQMKKGVIEQLNSELRLSTDEFGGALIAYNNIKLLQQMGCVMDEKPYIHFDIQADFVVFKPTIGCKLKGVVNKISPHHIGCLVHNCFNASIPQPHGSSKKWEGFKLSMGQEFSFEVTGIYSYNKVLSLRGKLPDTRSSTNKRRHSTLDADAADTSITGESDVLTSPISNKKKKKRHSDLYPSAANESDTHPERFTKITEKSLNMDDIQKTGKNKNTVNQNKEMDDLHNNSTSNPAYASITETSADTTSKKAKKKKARKRKSDTLGDENTDSVSVMDSSVTIDSQSGTKRNKETRNLDDASNMDTLVSVSQTVIDSHQSVSFGESDNNVLEKQKKKKKRRHSEPNRIINSSNDIDENSLVSSQDLFSDTPNGDAEAISNQKDSNTLENGLLSPVLDSTGNRSHKKKKSKKEKQRKLAEQKVFLDISDPQNKDLSPLESMAVEKTEHNTSSLAHYVADMPVKSKKHKKHKSKKEILNKTV